VSALSSPSRPHELAASSACFSGAVATTAWNRVLGEISRIVPDSFSSLIHPFCAVIGLKSNSPPRLNPVRQAETTSRRCSVDCGGQEISSARGGSSRGIGRIGRSAVVAEFLAEVEEPPQFHPSSWPALSSSPPPVSTLLDCQPYYPLRETLFGLEILARDRWLVISGHGFRRRGTVRRRRRSVCWGKDANR
jgi:hypothetical protein